MSLSLERMPYIRDLQKGLLEEGRFLVKRIIYQTGKKNKPFLRFLLADKSGHLSAIYFGQPKELNELRSTLKSGTIVKISGIIEEYQNVTQLKLLKIEPTTSTDDELSRFWARTPHDRRKLYYEMKSLIEKIDVAELKNLCLAFLKDRSFMKKFLEAPASRQIHHAYIGGLMEHSLNVMQSCANFARQYSQANFSLMVAGAFLHDIGKIDEYDFLLSEFEHSEAGRLKGHTLLGYERLKQKLDLTKMDANLRAKLEHIILSHQGKRIWGAIEEPRFLEAYLVHAADAIDSTQFIFSDAVRVNQQSSDSGDHSWSEYNKVLGREIFLR